MSLKKIQVVVLLLINTFIFGQGKGIDQQIDEVFGYSTGWFVDFIFYQIPFSEEVKIYWVLFPLILGALFFTFYLTEFINFRNISRSNNFSHLFI